MSRDAGDPARSADAQAVFQLVLRERQSRDRGWWSEMDACFAADAVIDMSWFKGPAKQFIAETRARSTNGVWGRHRPSPPAVRVHGKRAWAELPLAIEFPVSLGHVDAQLVSYCRPGYRAQKVDGIWLLARITSVYERDSPAPSLPGTQPPIKPNAFDGYRKSYRCLAWYFEQRRTPLADTCLATISPNKSPSTMPPSTTGSVVDR